MATPAPETPFKPLALADRRVTVARKGDVTYLSSPLELPRTLPKRLGDYLVRWAAEQPERVFLAERDGPGWRTVSYAETLARVRALAQALLELGLSASRPLALLSHNSIEHGLLQLAAMHVGIPVAPVSETYSLQASDLGKLRGVLEQLRPALVFAQDGERYARGLGEARRLGAQLLAGAAAPRGAARFAELAARTASADVERALEATGPDTVAKVLFTSGSTGDPKGVVNTQRMLTTNQEALALLWPFLGARPPVVVDWLPWSHTFGSNHVFNLVLRNGGTFYIDGGKPAPGKVRLTLENLRAVSPTIYFNVPRGYDALLPHLRQDAALRARFFERLDLLFYAAASLPLPVWDALHELAVAATGQRVLLASAWGATETAPMATCVHFPTDQPGVIGLPAPGTTIKLVPHGAKLELRVRGPNVTPGYWQAPELTEAAFDGEGFYRIGDAGKLVDPQDPARGLLFDGRVAEDFKLLSGTWVHTGALRLAAIAAGEPVVEDVVVTGQDRDEVGLLVFPNLAGCQALCGGAELPVEALIRRPEVRQALETGLRMHNAASPATSTRITRVLLLADPPSLEAGEVTDKGHVNQRAVLDRRAALVERLHAARRGDPDVILLG